MTPLHNGQRHDGLYALLHRAHCLLLDFDGPVCDLFGGLPADGIAERMHRRLAEQGVRAAGGGGAPSSDPHGLLGALGTHEDFVEMESFLAEEEQQAALSATPTPGAHDFVRAVAESGRLLAITTNNSPGSVDTYLKSHELDTYFGGWIFGRSTEHPTLMKPHPDCLLRAVAAVGVAREDCLMIGDSPRDAAAARAAGIGFLGFATSEDKAERLRRQVDRPLVVVGMEDLVDAAKHLDRPNG